VDSLGYYITRKLMFCAGHLVMKSRRYSRYGMLFSSGREIVGNKVATMTEDGRWI
jgi:hypothetical protein